MCYIRASFKKFFGQSGRAQEAYSAVCGEDDLDSEAVKAAVLKRHMSWFLKPIAKTSEVG